MFVVEVWLLRLGEKSRMMYLTWSERDLTSERMPTAALDSTRLK